MNSSAQKIYITASLGVIWSPWYICFFPSSVSIQGNYWQLQTLPLAKDPSRSLFHLRIYDQTESPCCHSRKLTEHFKPAIMGKDKNHYIYIKEYMIMTSLEPHANIFIKFLLQTHSKICQ